MMSQKRESLALIVIVVSILIIVSLSIKPSSPALGYEEPKSILNAVAVSNASTSSVGNIDICPNGASFVGSMKITLYSSTEEAEIYYTDDGTPPDKNSIPYGLPFVISQDMTLNARGYKDGLMPSEISSANFLAVPFGFELTVVDDNYPGNGKPGWSSSGDINGDGRVDVVAGGGRTLHWYEAPSWTRHQIEASSEPGGNGGLVVDVDQDKDLDVVSALFNSSLVWWENPGINKVKNPWSKHIIDSSPNLGFNHDLALGDIDGDGLDEIVALYVPTGGIAWYNIPKNPSSDPWTKTQILNAIDDPHVGLAVGDIDNDLDMDVVASNKWYERPSNPSTANWTERTIFSAAVQNVTIYDVNNDNRMDVVGAEGFNNPDGEILWAQSPENPKSQAWTIHLVAKSLDGPENIWAGDLDHDGLTDIVSGEMGTSTGWNDNDSNLLAFQSQNSAGTSWKKFILAENVGVSARINPTDINGDGQVDFTADGNAEDHIYLWVNQANAGDPVCIGHLKEHVYLPTARKP